MGTVFSCVVMQKRDERCSGVQPIHASLLPCFASLLQWYPFARTHFYAHSHTYTRICISHVCMRVFHRVFLGKHHLSVLGSLSDHLYIVRMCRYGCYINHLILSGSDRFSFACILCIAIAVGSYNHSFSSSLSFFSHYNNWNAFPIKSHTNTNERLPYIQPFNAGEYIWWYSNRCWT